MHGRHGGVEGAVEAPDRQLSGDLGVVVVSKHLVRGAMVKGAMKRLSGGQRGGEVVKW